MWFSFHHFAKRSLTKLDSYYGEKEKAIRKMSEVINRLLFVVFFILS